MKITGLSVTPVRMTLREPYAIAYEDVSETVNLFLRIDTERFSGIGCAAPDLMVGGETPESVERFLVDVVEPRLLGEPPFRRALYLEDLRLAGERNRAALAAVDIALLDLLGKACDRPLWQLLGGYRDRIKTSVTIGILPELETLEAARALTAQGFQCLKLKGGTSVESDIVRVLRVREEVGAEVELRFDANQGYSVDESVRFVDETTAADLELLEQPTAAAELDLLGSVRSQIDIPLMADESLLTLRDAFRLADRQLVDMVNIKIMKVGGIAEAVQIDSVARAGRMETMVGCMDESEVGIAAGLAFALARPNVSYADLDGHLDLIGDPARGSIDLRDGVLYPSDAPGLGVTMRD